MKMMMIRKTVASGGTNGDAYKWNDERWMNMKGKG